MEFGVSSRVDCGTNVIGLSWTAALGAADATLLVTTTEARVAVTAAEDRRLVSSWITRPGSHNRFSVAAVQNRLTRRFYCVQNGDRLFAWHEKDGSLETAVKVKLASEVYALRCSRKLLPLAVIFMDGGVSFFNEQCEEILKVKGQADGTIPTWARLTGMPGDDSRFILMVLKQSPMSAAGASATVAATGRTPAKKRGSVSSLAAASADQVQPYLMVYTISVRQAPGPVPQAPGKAPAVLPELYSCKLAATHTLSLPAGAPPSAQARVSAISLHKMLRALSIVWSTGDMEVVQFPIAAAWYAATPKSVVHRRLARWVPSDADASGAAPVPAAARPLLCGAAFALEPSCVVLAGEDASTGSVGLSVWDARYGVVLGDNSIPADFDAAAAPAAMSVPHHELLSNGSAAGRGHAASASSTYELEGDASSGGAALGSLLHSVAAMSETPLTPGTIFQVMVSEDNSHVAIASRHRVILTDVAARGASLLSAIGRMAHTRRFLADAGVAPDVTTVAAASVSLTPAPVLSLDGLIGPSVTPGTWIAAATVKSQQIASAVSAVCNASKTPTLATIVAEMSAFAPCLLAHYPTITPAAPKRSRSGATKSSSSSSSSSSDVDAPAPTSVVLPPTLVAAVVSRCLTELMPSHASTTAAAATSAHSLSADDVVTLLTPLIQLQLVSSAASPSLLPTLLTLLRKQGTTDAGAGVRTPGRRAGAKAGAAPLDTATASAALTLLCTVLTHLTDVPESMLVSVFSASVQAWPASVLAALWRSVAARATTSDVDGTAPDVLGLVYLTGLLVRAPRNDVFLEQALAALPVAQVIPLLACLLRLMDMHTRLTPAAFSSRKQGMPLTPTHAQVLDWLRMALDAHFTRLVLAAKAVGAGAADSGVAAILREVVRAVSSQVAVSESASLLRGHVLHLMQGGPMPTPPPPEHVVELLPL